MLVAETLIARLACELAARCRARRRGTCGCCGYFGHCNWVLVVAFVVVFAVRLRADWLHCLGFLCVVFWAEPLLLYDCGWLVQQQRGECEQQQ